ncbi:MAG: hypothetical protein F6K22_05025 [Okeania sp. SIO2F4]|nr:hypothetical protein [Okeania sp. SIO2F4]NES02253.1 hypothetical protein [Okeania sp. SIO2F4]
MSYTISQKSCYTLLGGEVWGVWEVGGEVKVGIIYTNRLIIVKNRL